jgi:hypothetical protein
MAYSIRTSEASKKLITMTKKEAKLHPSMFGLLKGVKWNKNDRMKFKDEKT